MRERQSLVRVTAERYQRSSKREKRSILDEFVAATRYHRSYASFLLSSHGRRIKMGAKVVFIGDVGKKRERKKRACKYGPELKAALKRIWVITDLICGKRLAAALPNMVPKLEEFGELQVSSEVREKLLRMSPATIDRLLSGERKRMRLKQRSSTKPGTLLRSQVPIRTFADWDDERPGFAEIDLVSHGGGDERGDFCQTLSATDVASGWSEAQAVRNKAQVWVFEALTEIRDRVPFDLLGIDSDNGSEFINHHLVRFCESEGITFTRSRPYRKNDNCFVEQKNYTIVRRAVGYMRHDTEKELEILNRLYSKLRLYTNYFLPSMKLIQKTRIGSKVVKRYDTAKTPFERLVESPHVPHKTKLRLKAEYIALNPARLKREITRLQHELERAARGKYEKRSAAPAPKATAPQAAAGSVF